MSSLNEGQFDLSYRMSHRPPDSDYGAPMHDIESMMPDFYNHPEYYDYGEENIHESVSVIQGARGRPKKAVRIYRAVPKETTPSRAFLGGDWVTPSRSYAKQHAASMEGMSVRSKLVSAAELYTEGNSVHEWGYHPKPREGR